MSTNCSTERNFSGDGDAERARKACLTCRRQKMRCVPGARQSCRRCERMQVSCIFRPRANAASLRDPSMPTSSDGRAQPRSAALGEQNQSILRRLARIETVLGLERIQQLTDTHLEDVPPDPALMALWPALSSLRANAEVESNPSAWDPPMIMRLWQTFHEAMPGLHFLPKKQTFTSPTPLLLGAMLYCSASRGPLEVAELAPTYYTALCKEISLLITPATALPIGAATDYAQTEEWAFQTVLGIVIATLLSEGDSRVTGLWISIAYRLLLQHHPPRPSDGARQWQHLFAGLQILDLEHASLHLSCPCIPMEPPLSAMHLSSTDQLYRLSRMMHTGLTHFTGRGLPTISTYLSSDTPTTSLSNQSFTGVDAAVLRDWARQLDDWLAQFKAGPFESETDRMLVYRQYVMHRLCVLSIYLPSRHCDLFSLDATPKERHELLLSARATIKLHRSDPSIWSNWDLTMMTWAALIVLQCVKGGHGEGDDLEAIRVHLKLLQQSNEPTPNLRQKLATRLEKELQEVGEASVLPVPTVEDWSNSLEYPWSLFDESSLQAVNDYFWTANESELQL